MASEMWVKNTLSHLLKQESPGKHSMPTLSVILGELFQSTLRWSSTICEASCCTATADGNMTDTRATSSLPESSKNCCSKPMSASPRVSKHRYSKNVVPTVTQTSSTKIIHIIYKLRTGPFPLHTVQVYQPMKCTANTVYNVKLQSESQK